MKKKLTAVALIVCMLAIMLVGASLAYFTDTDDATNEFTIGKIDITLNEDFVQGSKLQPGKKINKDVTITLEEGSEDAYVWYTYAIPAALDNDDASLNILHTNHAGQNWDDYFTEGNTNGYEGTATTINETWDVDYKVEKNGYTDEDGVVYNVYSVLYHGKLSAGDTTTLGLTQAYLDVNVDYNGTAYTYKGEVIENFPEEIKIIVNAYGIQAEGFADVYAAYDAYYAQ